MITADDSPEQQTSTFSLGANDYIIKPFIPAVVTRRVNNVLEANHRFKEMVREYNTMSLQVKTDLMTGLINRVSAQEMITQALERTAGTGVLVVLDIDGFKKMNDYFGHEYGDRIICAVADELRLHFKKDDIIARLGGDEFAVFIGNIPNIGLVEKRAYELCESMSEIEIDGQRIDITCSIGIALSDKESHSFEALYQNADKALYSAKCRGKNMVSIYGEAEEETETSIEKWINDAEGVLDALNDSIYACDKETYELIYANDNFCQIAGITREQCKGKKCHEVLMHRDTPCDFCTVHKISDGEMHTRLFQLPDTTQIYLMRGKNIHRKGITVHLEVAVDVTEIKNISSLREEMNLCGK